MFSLMRCAGVSPIGRALRHPKRLQAEGVHAKLHVYDGMIHGFAHYTGLDCGRQAMRDAGRMLTQAFEE